MSLEAELEELRRKHQELDDKIDRLSRPPFETYADLRPSKRQRLRLKEEIVRIESLLKRQ